MLGFKVSRLIGCMVAEGGSEWSLDIFCAMLDSGTLRRASLENGVGLNGAKLCSVELRGDMDLGSLTSATADSLWSRWDNLRR